jgi:pimeloyl-ACP methyl ester carboxylesterase
VAETGHRPAVLFAMLLMSVMSACGSAVDRPSVVGASPSASYSTPSAPALESCVQASDHAREVLFTSSNGLQLTGAELGSGPVGIVLAHQYMGNLCDWFPYADRLRDRGWRVLAFDFDSGLVVGVLGAAAELRREGATKVVLVGASMGGAASLAAAATISPPVDGVVSLSSPLTFQGVNASGAARQLTIPVLFMDALADGDFTAAARAMYAGCPSPHKQLLLLQGNDHGVELLTGSVAAPAEAALESFIATATT